MEKKEAKQLADYLNKVADAIPQGLSHLSDSITFAIADLTVYYRFGMHTKSLEKAYTFAKSIPYIENLKSDEFIEWMLNDREYLKYMP